MIKNPKIGDVVRWTTSDEFNPVWPKTLGSGPFVVVGIPRRASVHVRNLDGSPVASPTHWGGADYAFGADYMSFHNGAVDLDVFLTAVKRAIHETKTR